MPATPEAEDPQPPPSLHLNGFLERIAEFHEKSTESSFLFLLGAGASKESGIKTGGDMVEHWIKGLRLDSPDHEGIELSDWPTAERLVIKDFDPKDAAASYPEIFERYYRDRHQEGYDYLEHEIAKGKPSYGYSVLAQILSGTRHKIVVTTNFDNLVADALYYYTESSPIICGHESLAEFIRVRPSRPQIVKVHRDLFFAPQNDGEALGKGFASSLAMALKALFKSRVPIVIGYGGNDGTLMTFLEELDKKVLGNGLYWCHLKGAPPGPRICELVGKLGGWLVPISGFDALMLQLREKLKLGFLEKVIMDQALSRAEAYRKRQQKLWDEITAAPSPPTVSTSPSTAENGADAGPTALESLRSLLEQPKSRLSPHAWYQRAEMATSEVEKDRLYEEGIKALPESGWMAAYAAVHHASAGRNDEAEEQFKRALELEPRNPGVLGNYALFLTDVRGAHDRAEEFYKRALEADPKNADHLGNYALFLTNVRRDHDRAEEFYKRAIKADPKHAGHLGNYALFLTDVRGDHDGAEKFYNCLLYTSDAADE